MNDFDIHKDVCACGRARLSDVHAEGAINGHAFEQRVEPWERTFGIASVVRGPGGYHARITIAMDSCCDTADDALDEVDDLLLQALEDVRSLRAMLPDAPSNADADATDGST